MEDHQRHAEERHRHVKGQLEAFREALARLLSDEVTHVGPHEEQIGERVEHLLRSLRDRSAVSL